MNALFKPKVESSLHRNHDDVTEEVRALLFSTPLSDLHITEERNLWYRQGGDMIETSTFIPRGSVLTLCRDLFKVPGTFDRASLSCTIPDLPFRIRIRRSQSMGQVQLFVRLLPLKPPTLEEINSRTLVEDISFAPGLYIVAGATGSGKSTLLASWLQEILNHKPWHVSTIEDPVEYLLTSNVGVVSQREIPDDVHDGATALRNSLREDPDIIFVGEMRDANTARLALEASETGHQVYTTLHAADVNSIKGRFLGLLGDTADAPRRVDNALRWGVHLSIHEGARRACLRDWDKDTTKELYTQK